ncbi:hypothetical protein [Reyranella sp.]|jgi:hypothetical protein
MNNPAAFDGRVIVDERICEIAVKGPCICSVVDSQMALLAGIVAWCTSRC